MSVRTRARAAILAIAVGAAIAGGARQSSSPAGFAARIAALSEPPGYFDTDNLISNERSYLHVLPDMTRAGIRGGAYLGVGPDQNFSYIAQVQPEVAILIDLRRDNLLLHLTFKALFSLARTRVEYLALLTGRAPPSDVMAWAARPVTDLASYIDAARPLEPAAIARLRARVDGVIGGFGVPLSAEDRATIDRFHREFIAAGLDLRFRSTGRAPQSFYPDYRDLLLETDGQGRHGSFLASEPAFQFLKSLQARDLVIPVVGNLAGTTAMPAIAAFLAKARVPLSAFYTSNVEFYLFREGSFPRFVDNVARLPRHPQSLIIRSVFGGAAATSPGYGSASVTQRTEDLVTGFAAGRFRRYPDLVSGR